ncbi:MAG: cbb3-type cytochrome c oxidase subunit I [Ilumatobacteraceae bacterium]
MTTIETHAAVTPNAALAGIADWLTSTDHKRIGRLYLGVATLMLVASSAVAALLAVERIDITRELLDLGVLTQLFALARFGLTILVLAPLVIGVAIAVVPLQLGSRSLTFPRLAAAGFWLWFFGAVLAIYSLLLNGGPGGGNPRFVDLFTLAAVLALAGLLAGAMSLAATVLTSRAPGMNMRRVPFFSWSVLVMAVSLLVALPVVIGDLIVVMVAHRYPSLSELSGNRALAEWAGFGFTQPTTLLFAIPVLGVLGDVVATATGRRLAPRGVLLAGIGLAGTAVFATSLKSPFVLESPFLDLSAGDKLAELAPYAVVHLLPLLGVLVAVLVCVGALRTRPRLGAAFIAALFAGLLLLLGTTASAVNHIADAQLVGTVFEEGTWSIVVYAGVLAALAGVVHWGPKWWGRRMPTAITSLLVLLAAGGAALSGIPLLVAGFADQPGAVFPTIEVGSDAVVNFPSAEGPLQLLNALSAVGHLAVLVAVVAFTALVARSARRGERAGDDPWDGQTLEWATSSPAPADNFAEVHIVRSAEPLLDLKSSRGEA